MKLSGLTPKDSQPREQGQEWENVIDPDGIGSVDLDPAEIDEKRLRGRFDHWNSARHDCP
jgi:hypothetical protein